MVAMGGGRERYRNRQFDPFLLDSEAERVSENLTSSQWQPVRVWENQLLLNGCIWPVLFLDLNLGANFKEKVKATCITRYLPTSGHPPQDASPKRKPSSLGPQTPVARCALPRFVSPTPPFSDFQLRCHGPRLRSSFPDPSLAPTRKTFDPDTASSRSEVTCRSFGPRLGPRAFVFL